MQHTRVAIYQFKPGTVGDALAKAQAGLLPIYQAQPGFVGYGVVITQNDGAVSISIWQTPEQAQSAVETAAAWVAANVAELVVSVQNLVGDLAFFSSSGTIGG